MGGGGGEAAVCRQESYGGQWERRLRGQRPGAGTTVHEPRAQSFRRQARDERMCTVHRVSLHPLTDGTQRRPPPRARAPPFTWPA